MDLVEIVLELEDEYHISLADDAIERVETVADLAALVCSRLRAAPSPCPSQHAFYAIRRELVEARGVPRRSLRPSTPLDDAFPREHRRRLWTRISTGEQLPRLELAESARRSFAAVGTLALPVVVGIFIVSSLEFGTLAAVVAVLLAFPMLLVPYLRLRARFETRFPPGYATLGDLAQRNDRLYQGRDAGERLTNSLRVLDHVREMAARYAGVSIEKVKPESRLVKDLGLG